MKWSWTIGKIGGVALRVHATFVILLAWSAIASFRTSGGTWGAMRGVLFTLIVFASVVLHELGHAFAARHFGIPTRDITLLPIGGVARLDRMPGKPRQELVVALAGPVVTLALALVLYGSVLLLGIPVVVPVEAGPVNTVSLFLVQLLFVNAGLLLFNLMPAFPMDGGRVLRALLALRMDDVRATDVASRIAQALALILGIIGLLYSPLLVFIALFVWLASAGEAAQLHLHSALGGATVEQVMMIDIRTLEASHTLDTALSHVLAGFQQDFPVVDGRRVVGVLTRDRLMAGVAERGRESCVSASMDTAFVTADVGEPAESVLGRLTECHCQSIPVVRDGELRGMLTMENVGEYVMIEAALQSHRHHAQAGR